MKKIMFLLCILIGAMSIQAQTNYYTKGAQKATRVNHQWVWEPQTQVQIKVVMNGRSVKFENQTKTDLTMISDFTQNDDDKTTSYDYHAVTSKGIYCTFRLIHWKDDDQIQMYVIYNDVQYAYTMF